MYDVTIIGAGVAGVFLAYKLADSGMRVLLLDRGKKLADRRTCPLDEGNNCNCNVCDTHYGFGGLGKSEGKFNYSNGFGGELELKVGSQRFQELMTEVDAVLCQFGGDKVITYSTDDPKLSKRAEAAGLKMVSTKVRHLGTKLSIKVFQQLYEYVLPKMEMRFEQQINLILRQNERFLIQTNQEQIYSHKVVIATGRSGVDWLEDICKSFGIIPSKTRVDLGIRVEMKAEAFQSILRDTFETKLAYQRGQHIATTYCMNPKGRIVRKYQEGLVMPDGQNYREQGDGGSTNLNFTLFTPRYFKSLEDANDYAYPIIKKINRGRDRIVVQRWGDFIHRQATPQASMQKNAIVPTLQAHAGNLHHEVPLLYLEMLDGFMKCLQCFIREPLNEDTLLYGMDAKFYAPVIQTNSFFETTKVPNLFLIGDCSGITHSLSQAAASGLYLGGYLKKKQRNKDVLYI